MRRLATSRSFAGLIVVLVVAAGITAAAAQTGTRGGHAGVELTYTKWFSPGFPHMVGVVGGDIDGQFGGAVLDATGHPSGGIQLAAIYIIRADDPSRSLTVRLAGVDQSGAAVLKGRVIDGYLTGARARAEFTTPLGCSLRATASRGRSGSRGAPRAPTTEAPTDGRPGANV